MVTHYQFSCQYDKSSVDLISDVNFCEFVISCLPQSG